MELGTAAPGTLSRGPIPLFFQQETHTHSQMPARRTARARKGAAPSDRDLERSYSPKQFAAKLRRLADALEAGRGFTIQVAGEQLRIPADAEFNVEHERSAGEEELEFQLRWRRER